MRDAFRQFFEWVAQAVGSSWAFLLAVVVVLVWALTGPAFHYSDTWRLLINTGTTVVTFLMVFIIQSSQNRDTRVMNLKLDELLRALDGARTELVQLDTMTEEELEGVRADFQKLCDSKAGVLIDDDLARLDRALSQRRRSAGAKPAAPAHNGQDLSRK